MTLNNIVTLKSRLKVLKVIETNMLESLGVVSYSPTIVTIAVSTILYRLRDIATYWSPRSSAVAETARRVIVIEYFAK